LPPQSVRRERVSDERKERCFQYLAVKYSVHNASKNYQFCWSCLLIPPQTWTLKGCFGFGAGLYISPCLWNRIIVARSISTDYSSVNITLPKSSFVSMIFRQNSKRLILFASLTI